jgi:serine/threonine protein kinase
MVASFLPMDITLKVNYVGKDELEEEKANKDVPSLRNFDFIKVLGTGGFATVYMVRKRTTGQLYAMKLVKKDGVKQD